MRRTGNIRLRSERWPLPTDEPEFQAYMNRLDRYFAEMDMPVVARQIAAIAEACFDLGENRAVPRHREPKEGVYTGDDFLVRVIRWYDATYGGTLAIQYWLPPSMIYLRGELWRLRYPVVTGRGVFYVHDLAHGPAVKTSPGGYELLPPLSPERKDPAFPKFDVFDFVVDLPPAVRALIDKSEYPSILAVVCRNRRFLHSMTLGRFHTFMEEALGDIAASVDLILKRPPQTGAAKWASLQAAEKALKSYLLHAGVEYPTSGKKAHDLIHLASLVRGAGGPDFESDLLAMVQCSATVRYDTTLVDRREAARAHHAALEIAGMCAAANRLLHPMPSRP